MPGARELSSTSPASLPPVAGATGRPPLDAPSRPDRPVRLDGIAGLPFWLAFAVTWLAYAVFGLLGLQLALPPGYASPLYPSAGIALGAALVWGWRMVGAAGLGALTVNLTLTALRGQQLDLDGVLVPAGIAIGAMLQAALGVLLVRRFVSQPLRLSHPLGVARFFACTAASSIVSASVAVPVLHAAHIIPRADAMFAWATWWAGDLAGIVVITPIVLTLIGQPRADWRPRRVPVGLTLTLVTLCLALGIVQLGRWNVERTASRFQHDASSASLVLVTQLQEPLRALEALYGVANVSRQMSRHDVRVATTNWIGGGSVRAMGWSERVRRADLPQLEAAARAEGNAGFRVFDRQGDTGEGRIVPTDPTLPGDAMVLRRIEPEARERAAIGVNALSIPAARDAIETAIRTGQPAATRAFRLTQESSESEAAPGVVVYQAVYDVDEVAEAERESHARGVVFVTLRLGALLEAVASKVPGYLDLCVIDSPHLATRERIAGPATCDQPAAGHVLDRPMTFAGRTWDVRVVARASDVPDARDLGAWLFSLAGLLSAAMLGAALLITTGRTRRIESAVQQRTAALRAEVNERHVAESALRASEQRFRAILDNLPVGVVYTDLLGRVLQANPRFCEFVGFREAELMSLALATLTPPDELAAETLLTGKLMRGEIPMYRRHKRILTKAGEPVWLRATVTLLRDGRNAPWRIVGVYEDISEHLKLEAAERAREAAELANHAKSDFLSRMSHELRTPLNAMLGFAQLLEIDTRNPLAEGQRSWVGQIQQAGWHLLEMINDVLDLSRIESGNMKLHTTTVDLTEAITASVALVTADATRRNVRISEDIGSGSAGVLGDATRIKQILTNLLTNAVKYNVDGGRVHISSRLAGETVEITVTDTGMGMTAEQMEGLFKPFNRLGRERSKLEGTGIGLVISQRLAEVMGGSISVKSLSGEGSAFTLRLPRAQDLNTVPDPLDMGDSMPAEYHRRVVLYIEDNETNVEVMRGILGQRPQVHLEVAQTGQEGLAAMRLHHPHLLLLDLNLPDIGGIELLQQLKGDPVLARIPVVVVSADALPAQIDAAMSAGADRYLTKPVGVGELLATLDEVLDRMDTGFQ